MWHSNLFNKLECDDMLRMLWGHHDTIIMHSKQSFVVKCGIPTCSTSWNVMTC
jgi:hypothetical protein